jgi:NitT/TauT family transport system substrate-binding protein/sulfonate transport system substrate-binding protein
MIGKLTVLALAAIAALGMGPAKAADAPLELKLGVATSTLHAPIFIGVEKGFFAENGLDVKTVMYQSGVEMINGLLTGAQDVNAMGSIPFLSGVSNGFPLVLIGHLHGDPNRDYYADNNGIVVGAKSGIGEGDIGALKGKTIGLPRGTGAEGYLLGLLGQAGISDKDVTLVNIGPSELSSALQNGDVDAISVWEPWVSTATDKVPGAKLIIAGGCKTCYDPGTLLTTKQVAATKQEALRRFMVAMAESAQWGRQHLDEAAAINVRWIPGVELQVMQDALHHGVMDNRLSKNTPMGYTKVTLPELEAAGKLKKMFDPMTAIDPEFSAYAEETAPQYYSDLPKIPADMQLR